MAHPVWHTSASPVHSVPWSLVMVELSSPGQITLFAGEEDSMSETTQRFLCITSYEKGHDFLRQLADLAVKPTLLTVDKLRDAPWPTEVLEDLVTMPGDL